MWSVLRIYNSRCRIKSEFDLVCKATIIIKPHYEITCRHCILQISKHRFLCDHSISEKRYNKITEKNFDKHFHFIHQNDLYQSTTVNYNLLFDSEFKRDVPHLLDKIVLPLSSVEEKVQCMSDEELQQLMIYLIITKVAHKFKILSFLDKECAKRTLKWTVATSLYILDCWMMIDKKFTISGKFFNVSRNLWCQQLQHCSKENLLQIIYYLGESKQPGPVLLMDRLEKKFLQISKCVSLNEWSIVCNGFFKMKAKIKSAMLLHHIANSAIHHMNESDKYGLITILKTFRHACYFDENFLRFLENFIVETRMSYSVLECAHILAMFANIRWYNNEIFEFLENQIITSLTSAAKASNNGLHALPSFGIRIKDIARILWSFSHTGHQPKSLAFFETMDDIVKVFLDKQIDNMFYGVDCIQSLIVMGYYSDNIVPRLLKKDIFQKLKLSVKRKPLHQLYFIRSSTEIETPFNKSGCYSKAVSEFCVPLKSTYKDIRERLGVEQLITIMHRYCTNEDDFTCCFILPHIAISSICIETEQSKLLPNNEMTSNADCLRKKVSLEVLDPTVCLRNNQHCATGLMTCKIRQLRKLNYGVVIFTPDAIMRMTSMTTDNLKLYIDKILINDQTKPVVMIQ